MTDITKRHGFAEEARRYTRGRVIVGGIVLLLVILLVTAWLSKQKPYSEKVADAKARGDWVGAICMVMEEPDTTIKKVSLKMSTENPHESATHNLVFRGENKEHKSVLCAVYTPNGSKGDVIKVKATPDRMVESVWICSDPDPSPDEMVKAGCSKLQQSNNGWPTGLVLLGEDTELPPVIRLKKPGS